MLSDKDLARAASEIRDTPGGRIVTPGGVFKRLGCRPRCGNCFPLVVKVIHEMQSGREDDTRDNACAHAGSAKDRQLNR
ncbi:hypothetical protein [Breoghania sp. L-A4]|uniref:hypothetical protein n=1 Tax=Breoghania sp. L-A4 TaxID=2304600 RepID=UPI0020C095FE